jgi:hypothetical protein
VCVGLPFADLGLTLGSLEMSLILATFSFLAGWLMLALPFEY